jgi:hypothetical protein
MLRLWDQGEKQNADRKQRVTHFGSQITWQLQERQAQQVEFCPCVNVRNKTSFVYTKFYALPYMVARCRFEGPYRFTCFAHFLSTTVPLVTQVIYVHHDRVSNKYKLDKQIDK